MHEVYSPPRVNRIVVELGKVPGMSLDLSVVDPEDGMPWDFNNPEKAEKARRIVQDKRAILLIGSPMCTAFSAWHRLDHHRISEDTVREQLEYGIRHIEFALELCRIQIRNGLYFLHEHPHQASSWDLPCVRQLLGREDVYSVVGLYVSIRDDGKGVRL